MKPIPYVNDDVVTRAEKYYIFDWDDNILHMPTKIRMEERQPDGSWKLVEMSTAKFAVVRTDTENYRAPSDGGWDAAFKYFADAPDANYFLCDTIEALERIEHGEKPGPSYLALKKTLREGRLFAIVTARGHSPKTLELAVRVFIKYALTDLEREEMMSNLRGYRKHFDHVDKFGTDAEELDYYLSMCHYSGVMGGRFFDRVKEDPLYLAKIKENPSARFPELAKEYAIRDFVEHVFHTLKRNGMSGKPVSIGFSDDDKDNVKTISRYIERELGRRFEGFKFVVYDTSDRTLEHGRKVVVSMPERLI
ncbi:MAG: hypothetical protein II909_03655 [Kiritimatiellae bacterium]|nr:hypothetical protein [Kiritimatiellia bacterium]